MSIFGNFFSFAKMKKKVQSHLFESPGRYTGNRIIFMDSPRPDSQYGGLLLLSYRVGMLSERAIHVAHYDQTPWGSGEGLLPFRKNRPSVAHADRRRR